MKQPKTPQTPKPEEEKPVAEKPEPVKKWGVRVLRVKSRIRAGINRGTTVCMPNT